MSEHGAPWSPKTVDDVGVSFHGEKMSNGNSKIGASCAEWYVTACHDIVLEFDQGEAISRQIEHIGRVMVRAIDDAPFGEVPGGFGKALLAGSSAPDDES